MDHFGIGSALRGAANLMFHAARATGRTTSLAESVQSGDRVVFADERQAAYFRRLVKEMGKEVECVVADPRRPELLMNRGTPQGRLLFDHVWVERFYSQAIERAASDIDQMQRNWGGRTAVHAVSRMAYQNAAHWDIPGTGL